MAGEFAHQVTPGNPRRQVESLAGGVGVFDRDADLVQVRVRVERDDAIASWLLERERARATWTCGRRIGAPKTNRTSDLPLRRGLLYPLSYRGVT